jgi:hypothetical protein
MKLFSTAVVLTAAISSASATFFGQPDCKYLPGDSQWPSNFQWELLDFAVGGRLVKTVPLGTPCHNPNYNAAVCQNLQNNWLNPSLQ